MSQQSIRRLDDQVRVAGRNFWIVARERKGTILTIDGECKLVAQRDCLQDSDYLVITVRTLTKNAQIPVDFCEGWKCERRLGQRFMNVCVR